MRYTSDSGRTHLREAELPIARKALADLHPACRELPADELDKMAGQLLDDFHAQPPSRTGKFLDYAQAWVRGDESARPLPHRARHRYTPADPTAQAREGDELVSVLSPDAHLVIDASHNIVLRTPERRITIGDSHNWQAKIGQAKALQAVLWVQDENRRDENLANWRRDRALAEHALRRSNPARFKGMPVADLAAMVTRFVADFNSSDTQLDLDGYARQWEEGHR